MAMKFLKESPSEGFICEHELVITETELKEQTGVGSQTFKLSAIKKISSEEGITYIHVGGGAAYIIPEERVSHGDYNVFVDELRKRCS